MFPQITDRLFNAIKKSNPDEYLNIVIIFPKNPKISENQLLNKLEEIIRMDPSNKPSTSNNDHNIIASIHVISLKSLPYGILKIQKNLKGNEIIIDHNPTYDNLLD